MSQTPSSPPDVRQLQKGDLPETAFPGGRNQVFRVFLDPQVHTSIQRHSQENMGVEICGVVVGRWARDADGPFVHIAESIRGDAAANKFSEVTFTHETWAKINEQMDTRFSTLAIVGWYHSHPNFGVFLSDRDCFIQEHFFAGAGQVAYVVDPVRKTEGFFTWQAGKPTLSPHYWVGDRLQASTAAGQEETGSRPSAASHTGERGTRPASSEGPSWQLALTQGALYLMLFLLGFMLSGKLTDLERLRIEQGTLARAMIYLKLHTGLREELDQFGKDLNDLSKNAATLAKEHVKLAEVPQEAEERWREVLLVLNRSAKRLDNLQAAYCLTAEETALLLSLRSGKSKTTPEDKLKSEEKSKPDDKLKPPDEKGSEQK